MADTDFLYVEVTGCEEVCAMLDRLPKDMGSAAFTRALTAASIPVLKAMRVPQDTGELASKARVDITVDVNGTWGNASINFGPTWSHLAYWLEYGHVMYSHWAVKIAYFVQKGKRKKKRFHNSGGHEELRFVPPKAPAPFMRPAAEEAFEPAVEAFYQSMLESVSETYLAKVA